ncbi:Glycosyltransferase involved in cell wall bisynthesis [Actinacidiphila yanglinensis]|uniref:Glycosyltransferase involved in cell wall bisynthesis n=1 Tax=Actinacidiphila yanglinensis TaxID=310779 RepID=A0A1H6AHD7_9ACTN|nr:glycosyltransferase [Actinacidiphila yanglinensis]SEG47166.1 Glycosyltransferase involved in cell wall bisynthesis [Actinacidiphila yanglinensis]
MRVLHVITGLNVGGAEQQLRLLLPHLEADCEVLTLTDPGPVADAIQADGVRVHHLGMTGNRDVGVLRPLTALIRAGRYDVVHTHLYRACVYGRLAARLAGVRTVVATEHSLGATQIEGRPLTLGTRALYRATERLGHGTLAVSTTVAERLVRWGVPRERVHLAPNGIDPEPFRFDPKVRSAARVRLGIPEDAYVVGGVGRQVPGKRFDALVRAVADVPGSHLVLAGDGPERVPLLRLVHRLNLQHRVHVTDSSGPDVPALLAAMDLFVSASAEEAFGLAVVEALAAGLPVLHTACPAVEDLPAEDAPGTRRIDLGELPAALAAEHRAGPRRLPVPAAVGIYHIARTAQRVMALYAEAGERHRPRPHRQEAAATVPHPARAATPPQAPPAAPAAPAATAEPTTPTPAQK